MFALCLVQSTECSPDSLLKVDITDSLFVFYYWLVTSTVIVHFVISDFVVISYWWLSYRCTCSFSNVFFYFFTSRLLSKWRHVAEIGQGYIVKTYFLGQMFLRARFLRFNLWVSFLMPNFLMYFRLLVRHRLDWQNSTCSEAGVCIVLWLTPSDMWTSGWRTLGNNVMALNFV